MNKVLATGCLGSVIVGVSGFLLGFIGPIILTPQSNQGPLLGIFITGPLGFVLGGVGGCIYGAWKQAQEKREE